MPIYHEHTSLSNFPINLILTTIRSIQAVDVKLGSPTNMIAAIQNGIWTIEDVTPNRIRKAFQHEDCLATVLWQKKSSSTLFGSSQTSIGDELPLDIFGPYRPPDIRGHRYFTLVVNANTLY